MTEATRAKDLSDGLGTSLDSCGLAPVPLTNDLYKEIFTSILNQGQHASWREDPQITADEDKPLNEQILDFNRAVQVRPDRILIGDDCMLKTLSIKKFPDIMWQGEASQYLADIMSQRGGIRGNCVITMTLFFPPQLETKDKLSRGRSWAINQTHGPMATFVPKIVQKRNAYETLCTDLDRQGPAQRTGRNDTGGVRSRQGRADAGYLQRKKSFLYAELHLHGGPLCRPAGVH